MTNTFGIINTIQVALSKGQAIPLIGPLLISPLKAKFSLIEIIVGVVATIFLSLAAVFTALLNSTTAVYCFLFAIQAFCSIGQGVSHLAYSIVNFLSLGIIGFCIEFL